MPAAVLRRKTHRRLALLALGLLVTLAHLSLGDWWFEQRMGFGLGDAATKAISVRFVTELLPAPPPRVALTTTPATRKPPPVRPALAAEAPAPPPEAPSVVPAQLDPAPAAPQLDTAAADQTPPPRLAAVDPLNTPQTSFDWPPSTQLLYTLTGNYRGPVQGDAEVDWLREGDRYQVKLELRVPPLFGRRILSDGVLGPQGLSPRRYEQETEVLLQATRRDTVLFDGDQVLLANNRSAPARSGMQDTASQFVQMTWLFLTQPELLRLGGSVAFPLVLPGRVAPWRYDVVEQAALHLPFGEVMCFHLQPAAGLTQPGELSVETWVAPELQYLPVRIVVRQGADTFLALELKSAPRQAAPAAASASAASASP